VFVDQCEASDGGAVNETGFIAVAGIAGTLIGALAGPAISERMRRRSARREVLTSHQIGTYADLLTAGARIVDNAIIWAAAPTAKLEENRPEVLESMASRVRVLADREVFEEFQTFWGWAQTFHRHLDDERIRRAQTNIMLERPDGHAVANDHAKAIAAAAEEMTASYQRLVTKIRKRVGH
jgi:hypothetical protein